MFDRLLTGTFAIFVVISISVYANPIIIRSGLQKNHEQQQDSRMFDAGHAKGIANYEGDEGFNNDLHSKQLMNSGTGRYGENRGVVQDRLGQNNFDRGSFQQNGGGSIADLENKKAHNKGHHKSGFHNSYHKDEQGSNSSFYDDAGDQGDEYLYRTNKGSFGDAARGNARGANLDASHYANQGGQQHQYDNGDRLAHDRGARRNYNRNQYLDDREMANRRSAANAYGEGGRYHEDRYAERPHYNQIPHHEPYFERSTAPKRHITIYEDPRYVPRAGGYQQYDDYVELDVRPMVNHRRYDRRADPFDYYY